MHLPRSLLGKVKRLFRVLKPQLSHAFSGLSWFSPFPPRRLAIPVRLVIENVFATTPISLLFLMTFSFPVLLTILPLLKNFRACLGFVQGLGFITVWFTRVNLKYETLTTKFLKIFWKFFSLGRCLKDFYTHTAILS